MHKPVPVNLAKPSWLQCCNHTPTVWVGKRSHGVFTVHTVDVDGKPIVLTVTKGTLRSITLIGTRIFSDVVSICREKVTRIVPNPHHKRSIWQRIKIAVRIVLDI